MTGDYQYAKTDESLLAPLLEERIIPPLLKVTPWRLPANLITVASNMIWYLLAIAVAGYGGEYRSGIFILVAAGIFLYVIGDFLDGEQAKRTDTRSPLGDFLDHYLDAFNNGVLIFLLTRLFDVSGMYLYTLYLTVSYIAGTALVYEHYRRGVLYFGKVGTTEGLFLAMTILLAASVSPVRALLTATAVGDISWFALLFLVLTGAGYIPTLINVFRRVGEIPGRFVIFVISMVVIGVTGSLVLSPVSLIVVVTLHSCVYIGRLHRSRVLKLPGPVPDVVLPAVFLGAALFPVDGDMVGVLTITYLALQVGWIVGRTLYALRRHWLWINPRRISSP